jgi:hypothetical protein
MEDNNHQTHERVRHSINFHHDGWFVGDDDNDDDRSFPIHLSITLD